MAEEVNNALTMSSERATSTSVCWGVGSEFVAVVRRREHKQGREEQRRQDDDLEDLRKHSKAKTNSK